MASFVQNHSAVAVLAMTLFVAVVGYFEHLTVRNPEAACITWFFGALFSAAGISRVPVPQPLNWVLSALWLAMMVVLLARYLRIERKRRRSTT
jgi:hypothetical protein